MFKKRELISVSAIKKGYVKHIGSYYDKATADRVKEHIEYFAGGGFKVLEK